MDDRTADRIRFLEQSLSAWKDRAMNAELEVARLKNGMVSIIDKAKGHIVHPPKGETRE